MKKLISSLTLVMFLSMFIFSMAADSTNKTTDSKKEEPKVVQVTMSGKIDCIYCAMKYEVKAGSQCSAYGHTDALKLSKATDANGKTLDIKEGTWIHFLPSDKSKELGSSIKHGQKAELTGKYYPSASTIEIESFKKIEDKK